jgi:transcription elongation factor Elf1
MKDSDDERLKKESQTKLKDWDCPQCNANNPSDEMLSEDQGVELRCHYCGVEFLIAKREGGRLKFKEI